MIRHCVLLRFHNHVDSEAIDGLDQTLADLSSLPMIRDYRFGRDLKLADGNVDYAIIADFANAAAYEVYAQDPVHLDILKQRIRPLVAERTALQFEWPEG
ncbi:MAG: Dabb family protein [Pseudomonadota bacterium]